MITTTLKKALLRNKYYTFPYPMCPNQYIHTLNLTGPNRFKVDIESMEINLVLFHNPMMNYDDGARSH